MYVMKKKVFFVKEFIQERRKFVLTPLQQAWADNEGDLQ